MRVSTRQIYSSGVLEMERNQSQLVKLQNQIASGRRQATAADDPLAAAQALGITQAREVAAVHARHQAEASDRLRLVDSQLEPLTDLLQSVRSRALQAGNTVLTDADRLAIAAELEARFEQLLGIANSRSATGEYLFAGHQGTTQPFARSAASDSVAYFGDQGEHLLQVTSTQQMATHIAGSELFLNIREGNGTFVTAAGGGALANQGSGVIDSGALLDPEQWQSAVNGGFSWQGTSNRGLQIVFSSQAGVSSYQLFDGSTPAAPAAALPPRAVSPLLPFTPGQAIALTTTTQPPAAALSTDFGAQVVINGVPAAGDTFTVRPSARQSVFQTLQQMITSLQSPLTSSSDRKEFSGQLQGHLQNLDQALAHVSRVQSVVGARLLELDALSSQSAALDIQYQQTLSHLEDVDYAQAISDFTRQQLSLEAAQKSFVTISGLSLFNYL